MVSSGLRISQDLHNKKKNKKQKDNAGEGLKSVDSSSFLKGIYEEEPVTSNKNTTSKHQEINRSDFQQQQQRISMTIGKRI
jgi:hypothetical protein